MTPEEAIKYLEHHGYISDDVKDMCIEALEKQIPRKCKQFKDICDCKKSIFPHMKYCSNCGQVLDWSDEK